jgi:tRNA splicing ligase
MGRLRNPVSNSDVSDNRRGLQARQQKANAFVVFIAILQDLKETTIAARDKGDGMSKDEAEKHEKDLNTTLKEDPNLKQYELTVESLAKMVPHPSVSLEWVRKSYDSLPE